MLNLKIPSVARKDPVKARPMTGLQGVGPEVSRYPLMKSATRLKAITGVTLCLVCVWFVYKLPRHKQDWSLVRMRLKCNRLRRSGCKELLVLLFHVFEINKVIYKLVFLLQY